VEEGDTKKGRDLDLHYPELQDVQLLQIDEEEEGVRWSTFRKNDGSIVLIRSRFEEDEDGWWDELRKDGRKVALVKYEASGRLYERANYVYDDSGKFIRKEIFDGGGKLLRVAD
jgi:hypothetical protein